jgi:hypothetical protein
VQAAECRPHPKVKQDRGARHIFPSLSLSLHYTAVRRRTHTALRAAAHSAPSLCTPPHHISGEGIYTTTRQLARATSSLSRLLLAPVRSVRPQRIGFPCSSCAHPGRAPQRESDRTDTLDVRRGDGVLRVRTQDVEYTAPSPCVVGWSAPRVSDRASPAFRDRVVWAGVGESGSLSWLRGLASCVRAPLLPIE